MSVGVHDFQIPHSYVQPMRDMVIIRVPLPPQKVGSVHVPQIVRDLAFHNVQAGRIVAMGPLAFSYKDENGLQRQNVKIGDWVVIRQFAGTLMQGGKLQVQTGWRYVSSFQDVIGIIPADQMPAPETLLWDEEPSQQATEGGAVDPKAQAESDFSFNNAKAGTTDGP